MHVGDNLFIFDSIEVRCSGGQDGQTCANVAHHSNGCPLELVDYECTGSICALYEQIGGQTWDGEKKCKCKSRMMNHHDLAL